MATIQIGNARFRSFKNAVAEANSILSDETMEEDEADFIMCLAELHPSRYEHMQGKIMSVAIEIERDEPYFVVYSDLEERFYFKPNRCSPTPPSKLVVFSSKLRRLIKDQVEEFRAAAIERGDCCDLCGKQISADDVTHVDHTDRPFHEIRDHYLTNNNFSPDSRFTKRFVEGWLMYHEIWAKVRLLHKSCHAYSHTNAGKLALAGV